MTAPADREGGRGTTAVPTDPGRRSTPRAPEPNVQHPPGLWADELLGATSPMEPRPRVEPGTQER